MAAGRLYWWVAAWMRPAGDMEWDGGMRIGGDLAQSESAWRYRVGWVA